MSRGPGATEAVEVGEHALVAVDLEVLVALVRTVEAAGAQPAARDPTHRRAAAAPGLLSGSGLVARLVARLVAGLVPRLARLVPRLARLVPRLSRRTRLPGRTRLARGARLARGTRLA